MGLAGFEVEVQRPQADGGLSTEDMTLSMGPQHPSTHGVLRFVVRADGEVMKEAIPDIGYLHRSIEKIAEKVGWHGFMPYTDRVDYVAAMPCNQGWARQRRGGDCGGRHRLQPGRAEPPWLGCPVRCPSRRAVLRLSRARFRDPRRPGRDGEGGRLLRPLHRPHPGDEGVLQDPPPMPAAAPPGSGDHQGGA